MLPFSKFLKCLGTTSFSWIQGPPSPPILRPTKVPARWVDPWLWKWVAAGHDMDSATSKCPMETDGNCVGSTSLKHLFSSSYKIWNQYEINWNHIKSLWGIVVSSKRSRERIPIRSLKIFKHPQTTQKDAKGVCPKLPHGSWHKAFETWQVLKHSGIARVACAGKPLERMWYCLILRQSV